MTLPALAFRPGKRSRSVIFILALILLIAGIVISLRRSPELITDARLWPMVIVLLLGVPLTLLVNAMRYMYSARLIGIRVRWSRAMEVMTVSTAANMLPLPGGTIVRLAALSEDSVSLKSGSKATIASTGIWVSITLIFAGSAVAFADMIIGSGIAAVGILCLLATVIFLFLFPPLKLHTINLIHLGVIELMSAAVDALRFMFSLLALGLSVHFYQAGALVAASLAGSAAGFVPAGLGVREVASALMGPLVNLSPEACFISATLNRVIGLIGITPVAAGFLWNERRNRRASVVSDNRE